MRWKIKRALDRMTAALLLIALSPALAAVALAIAATSGRPVFFQQTRAGRNGRLFRLYKFRTLPPSASKRGDFEWSREPVDGVSRFLRATGLDEAPQLWNVLIGDMSLIGPRPERPFFVQRFRRELRDYDRRHSVPAGISGWAQVHGWRGDTSIARRLEHDLYYVENWSLALDLQIVLKTLTHLATAIWRCLRRDKALWRSHSTSLSS